MGTIAFLTQLLLLGLGLFLMIVILLQRGRGGGLAGAFGGLGGQSAFGTKAGDVFTKITIGIAIAWVVVAGGSGYFLRAAAERRAAGLGEVEQAADTVTAGDEGSDLDMPFDASAGDESEGTGIMTPEAATGADASAETDTAAPADQPKTPATDGDDAATDAPKSAASKPDAPATEADDKSAEDSPAGTDE